MHRTCAAGPAYAQAFRTLGGTHPGVTEDVGAGPPFNRDPRRSAQGASSGVSLLQARTVTGTAGGAYTA